MRYGALEIAAQACSASLGSSNWPLDPARPCWGVRNRSSGLLGQPSTVFDASGPTPGSLLSLAGGPQANDMGSDWYPKLPRPFLVEALVPEQCGRDLAIG